MEHNYYICEYLPKIYQRFISTLSINYTFELVFEIKEYNDYVVVKTITINVRL